MKTYNQESARKQSIATFILKQAWNKNYGGICPCTANHACPVERERSYRLNSIVTSDNVSILFRPEAVAHRSQFGHWEGDLMLFKQHFGQANVTSLVERVSRFTVLLRNSSKHTNPVMKKIASAIGSLPFIARRSITFDRGTEFVSWPHLQSEIGTQAWFCDPSAPWQKGTVENTNRRIRRWLPRQINLKAITDHELKMICDRLNQTPRKCLGWKTPAEVFKEKMLEQAERTR